MTSQVSHPPESGEDNAWETSEQPAVILALCYSGGFLGASVYQQSTTTVQILHDIGEDAEFHMVKSLINQVNPSVILVNKSQDLQLIRYLSNLCGLVPPPDSELNEERESGESADEEGKVMGEESSRRTNQSEPSAWEHKRPNRDVTTNEREGDAGDESDEEEDEDDMEVLRMALHLLPNVTYKYEAALKRISQLFEGESLNACENNVVVNFRIDTKSKNMVRALGALLKYMDAIRIGVEFDALNVTSPISAIKTFLIEEMVEIDNATYRALEIFGENRKQECSWRKTLARDPSRLTLFSLCNRCRSSSGKNMLRKWFEHPTLHRETLRKRQRAISFFAQDCNLDVTSAIHQKLGKVRSLRMILKRMSSSTCKIAHWENLYQSLVALVSMGRCIREKNLRLAILEDEMAAFGDQLSEITTVIATICDFEESRVENRLVVSLGVDDNLDEIKHIYRQLPTMLTRVARDEAARLRAESCSVGYVPMVGYLLALPPNFPVSLYPDLRSVYETADAMQVKSDRMDRLDEELGDIKMEIIDKETTVMLRLQKMVLQRSEILLAAARLAATLDAIISLALTARHMGWTCPTLVDEPLIEASHVVHPLAQIVQQDKKKFVPNPISCGGESTKVKIFTGPNACGKSVYLKQVGVLAFLAHVGSFVPADRCVIGPVNRIMTRMYTVDGVLDGMSTFAKDLQQLAVALRRGNQFSLVIVDEFGKGTMTEVGLSLLASSLHHWLSKGVEGCPHLFVSSHFHALPTLIDIESDLVTFQTLEVLRRGSQLEFQFRLVDGIVDKSFAAHTALKMGIQPEVVHRANEVYDCLRNGTSLCQMKVGKEEEKKCLWLEQRMDNLMFEFETWNIDDDLDGLLKRMEEVLVDDDETLNSTRRDGELRANQSNRYVEDEEEEESVADEQRSGETEENEEGADSQRLNFSCWEREDKPRLAVSQVVSGDSSHKTPTVECESLESARRAEDREREIVRREETEVPVNETERTDSGGGTRERSIRETTSKRVVNWSTDKSILRGSGRRVERSNMSVSFALDVSMQMNGPALVADSSPANTDRQVDVSDSLFAASIVERETGPESTAELKVFSGNKLDASLALFSAVLAEKRPPTEPLFQPTPLKRLRSF